MPWKALLDLIDPHYPKTSSKGGLPPYPLETMLRIHLQQQWYDLSDPAMEHALIEGATMRRFGGIALISDQKGGRQPTAKLTGPLLGGVAWTEDNHQIQAVKILCIQAYLKPDDHQPSAEIQPMRALSRDRERDHLP